MICNLDLENDIKFVMTDQNEPAIIRCDLIFFSDVQLIGFLSGCWLINDSELWMLIQDAFSLISGFLVIYLLTQQHSQCLVLFKTINLVVTDFRYNNQFNATLLFWWI